jgi:hypothetical protein
MSRAINIDASETDVTATCTKLNAAISAIEPLESGGVRVVLNNGADADKVRKAYGSKVLTGEVRRTMNRLRRGW